MASVICISAKRLYSAHVVKPVANVIIHIFPGPCLEEVIFCVCWSVGKREALEEVVAVVMNEGSV